MSHSLYKGKTRVRACGVLVHNKKLLLVQLESPVSERSVWTPPGGGIKFGEPLKHAVVREFKEESGLNVRAEKLIFINEMLQSEFHALEFYMTVSKVDGNLSLGKDPEHSDSEQILSSINFFGREELQKMEVAPVFFKNEFWNIYETAYNGVTANWAS